MLLDRVLLAPWRVVSHAFEDLDALAEAVRDLPRLERRLSVQLSGLIARIGEIAMHVEQVPGPIVTIAHELPLIGRDVGMLKTDLERVGVLLDGVSGELAGIDPRLLSLEHLTQQLSAQITGVQANLHALTATVTTAAEQLPGPDDTGLIGKARDVLTGSGAT